MKLLIGTNKSKVEESIFSIQIILTKKLSMCFNIQRPITIKRFIRKLGKDKDE